MKKIFIVAFILSGIARAENVCIKAGYEFKQKGFFGLGEAAKEEKKVVTFFQPTHEMGSVHKYGLEILKFKFIFNGTDWIYYKDNVFVDKAFSSSNNIMVSKQDPKLVVRNNSNNSLEINRQDGGDSHKTRVNFTFTKEGIDTSFYPSEIVIGEAKVLADRKNGKLSQDPVNSINNYCEVLKGYTGEAAKKKTGSSPVKAKNQN